MFCAKCGAKIKDGSRFCGNCGWKVPSSPKSVPAPEDPSSKPAGAVNLNRGTGEKPVAPKSGPEGTIEKPAAQSGGGKKGTGKKIILAVILLAVLGTGAFFGIRALRGSGEKDPSAAESAPAASGGETQASAVPAGTEDAAETVDEQDLAASIIVYGKEDLPQLVLYADRAMFYADEDKDVALTVRVPQDLAFAPVRIGSADGQVALAIEEDAPAAETEEYREYRTTLHLAAGEPGVLTLTATMDGQESLPLDIYNTTHITREMMQTCMDVGTELEAWLEESGKKALYEEDRGDEVLAAVLEWLQADARVADAQINGENIVYVTTDHVGGMYLPPVRDGMLGSGSGEEGGLSVSFADSGKAAEALENLNKTGSINQGTGEFVYLDGALSITNDKFLVMTPWEDTANTVVGWLSNNDIVSSGSKHLSMAKKYASDLSYQVTPADYAGTLEQIFNRHLNEYGIITLMCHGSQLERKDGTYSAIFCLPGSSDGHNGRACFELMAELELKEGTIGREEDAYQHFYREKTFNADHTLACLDGGAILIGGNLIRHRYQDTFFDNTIFYTGACYGGSDETLIRFCISHGMKAYIGYQHPVSPPAEQERFARVFSDLKDRQLFSDETKTLETSARIGTLNDNYRAHLKYFSWRVVGYGDLEGTAMHSLTHVVIHRDGSQTATTDLQKPGEAVKLQFWRFMDQSFISSDPFDTETDKDGRFKMEHLRYGVYGVIADPGGDPEDATYAGVTLADESFDGGTLEVLRPTATVTAHVVTRQSPDAEPEPVPLFAVSFKRLDGREPGKVYETAGAGGVFAIEDLPAGRYLMTVSSDTGSYTETVELKKSHDYEYEEILLTGRVIDGAVVGTKDEDDMWYAYLFLLDANRHLILTDAGNPSVLTFSNVIFGGGVYEDVPPVGRATVWKIDGQTLLVRFDSNSDFHPAWTNVCRLDAEGKLVKDETADVSAYHTDELELLLDHELTYQSLPTREAVMEDYYVPADTPKDEDRPIDALLADVRTVFMDPELASTDLENAEDGTLTAYTETWQKGSLKLIVRALADGSITTIRIDDHSAYRYEDYKDRPDSSFFTASEGMRNLYQAVTESKAVGVIGDRKVLAGFDFAGCEVSERSMNGTHLGYECSGELTEGNVTVTYVKSTHEIPSTSFTSFVEIALVQ